MQFVDFFYFSFEMDRAKVEFFVSFKDCFLRFLVYWFGLSSKFLKERNSACFPELSDDLVDSLSRYLKEFCYLPYWFPFE
jgi:hypothetical protein